MCSLTMAAQVQFISILFDRGGRELPIEPTLLGESFGEEGVERV